MSRPLHFEPPVEPPPDDFMPERQKKYLVFFSPCFVTFKYGNMQINSFDLNEFNELVQHTGSAIHYQSLCYNFGHFKNKSMLRVGLFC